ncbi:FAD-dependent oxidoreductase [Falsiroseomonas sp.]|uniref:FAD-dependent oxidoreductase n=1 Tax=Falsiroseomonas sp. TaxID=2870721 RepID=UPI003F6F16AA
MTLDFEGRAIAVRPGQSLAAALTEAGVLDLRESRSGGRGLYCGMGACQDCVMVVDGVPNTRACMTKAVSGQQVKRQPHPAPLPTRATGTPPLALEDLPEETPDLLVVGGGAGGLAAALAARRAGVDVLLVDERSIPGGQYYKQAMPGLAPMDAQQSEGAALLAACREAGVRILDGTEVWGAFAPLLFLATRQGRTLRLRPRAAVLATGAQERALPFPGWTLPGVMTTGAAQTLWRSYRTLPGRRLLVAGNGPLNLQVALELAEGGAEVVAVAEASSGLRPLALARMLRAAPKLAAKGLGMLAALRRRGIPLKRGRLLRSVTRAVDGALLVELDDGTRQMVDAVLCGYGFQPENALLRAIGATHAMQDGLLRPQRDSAMRTSIEGLYAVGDGCGLGGAPAALAEGEIAGLAVARSLGHAVPSEAPARARLARHRAFQNALWQVFATPFPGLSLAQPETLICRCEEVMLAQIDAAIAAGPADIGEVKRRTRCGMGRCQGRYCGPLLAARMGVDDSFAPRVPARPLRISDLIGP